jgi:hypothetical protein
VWHDHRMSRAPDVAAVGWGTARFAAVVAAVGFALVALFQLALALGVPWGRAAWGGAHQRLPTGLRVASGFAVILWIVAAVVILTRAGFASLVPAGVARWGTWVLFAVLVLGTLMNLASRSRLERLIQTPVAGSLAILCLFVALG